MFQPVIKLLQAYNIMSEPLFNRLRSCIVRRVFPRGSILLKEGEICRYIYFISEGFLRSYVVKGNKEINIWYMMKDDMAAAAKSFHSQEPAKEFIEAMKETEVYCLSFEHLESISREFPEFQGMVLKLLWKYHTMFYDRLIDLLRLTPEERYQYLLKTQPELIQLVKEKYLSSYMGMSVATWTRAKQNKGWMNDRINS